MRSEVLTSVTMQITIFYNVMPCTLAGR